MEQALQSAGPIIKASQIEKSFGGRRVLHGVSVEACPGEVHALVGANGSGKSTLVKILSGTHQPDRGTITLAGRDQVLASPAHARSAGIRIVHQEAPLVDTLSVAECVALTRGFGTRGLGRIRWKSVREEARRLAGGIGLSLDVRLLAGGVSSADRALVSMAVALDADGGAKPTVLILDEVTAPIPEEEATRLLAAVRRVADDGTAVLMVTHRLREVSDVADRVTVLASGRVVHSGPASLGREELISKIAGEREDGGQAARLAGGPPPPARRPSRAPAPAAGPVDPVPPVTVKGLQTARLAEVEFTIGGGEFLGVVGGPESGIEELPPALVGALPATGTILLRGRTRPLPRSPRDALRAGVVLVPRDRLRQGGIGGLSVHDNVLLPSVGAYWHRGVLSRDVVAGVLDEFDVRPRNSAALLRQLSGGNQQKVIVGKWLICRPTLLILDDPTLGIDPGARQKMFEVLKRRAREEMFGVLLLSSEPEELVSSCDRILAFSGGQVAEELTDGALSYGKVAAWAAG